MGSHTEKYLIRYMDVDSNLTLRANRCLDLLQEIAFAHSEDVGASFQWLEAQDLGWVITVWQMQINRLPKAGEKMELKTSTAPLGRIQAARHFWAKDEQGAELFSAQSLWVLMNKTSRRPSRMPKDLFEKYGEDKSAPLLTRGDFDEPDLQKAELFKNRQFFASRRDVDSNKHINNVAYLTWSFDDLPEEIYASRLTGLDVRYHTEAKPGTEIKACTYVNESYAEDGSRLWQVTSRFLPVDARVPDFWPKEEEVRAPYYAKVTSFWADNK